MVEILASIVGALAAGALAKAGDIGGRAAVDAYDGLRALIVRKLGKGGAVQSVEDEPRSETAQAALAEALTKAGLAADPELAQHAEVLRAAVTEGAGTGGADIEVGDIIRQGECAGEQPGRELAGSNWAIFGPRRGTRRSPI